MTFFNAAMIFHVTVHEVEAKTKTLTAVNSASRSFITPVSSSPAQLVVNHRLAHPVRLHVERNIAAQSGPGG